MDIDVAKLGRAVGLKGWMKLHLMTDFPEQFKPKIKYSTKSHTLQIEGVDLNKEIVKFYGFDTKESVQPLVNLILKSTVDESRKNCHLKNDEFFYFDILSLDVYEDELYLGKVFDIEKIGPTDYLYVSTAESLINTGHPKRFLLPYLDRYVIKIDLTSKKIFVQNTLPLII